MGHTQAKASITGPIWGKLGNVACCLVTGKETAIWVIMSKTLSVGRVTRTIM